MPAIYNCIQIFEFGFPSGYYISKFIEYSYFDVYRVDIVNDDGGWCALESITSTYTSKVY